MSHKPGNLQFNTRFSSFGRSRHSWRRRLLHTIWHILVPFILILTAGLVAIFFSFRWSTHHLRVPLSAELSHRLKREVKIRDVSGAFFNYLVLKDVDIARGDNLSEGKLFHADRIKVRYDLWGVLWGKKLPISSISRVEVFDHELYLERDTEGKLNIADLLKPRKPPPRDRFRGKVVFANGKIEYIDQTILSADGSPLQVFVDGLAGGVKFRTPTLVDVSIRGKGKADWLSSFSAQIHTDIDKGAGSLTFSGKNINLETIATYLKEIRKRGKIWGLCDVKGHFIHEIDAKGERQIDYRVRFQTEHLACQVPELPDTIHAAGWLTASPHMLSIDDLRVSYSDSLLLLSGQIVDFSNPKGQLSIQAPLFDFKDITPYLPATIQHLKPQVMGLGQAYLGVFGKLRNPTIQGKLYLPEVRLEVPRLGEISASDVSVPTVLASWQPFRLSAETMFLNPQAPALPSWVGKLNNDTGIGTKGEVSLTASIIGDKPMVEGSFNLPKLTGLSDFPLAASGNFILDAEKAYVEKLEIDMPTGQTLANLSLEFKSSSLAVSAQGILSGVRLSQLCSHLSDWRPNLKLPEMDGDVNGTFVLNHGEQGWQAMAKTQIPELRYGQNLKLRQINSLIKFDGEGLQIVAAEVADPSLKLAVSGTLAPDGNLELEFRLHEADLEHFGQLVSSPGMKGKIRAFGKVDGPHSHPSVTMEAMAMDAEVSGLPIDSALIKVSGNTALLKVEEALLTSGSAHARASGAIACLWIRGISYPLLNLETSVEISDVAALTNWSTSPLRAAASISATVSGFILAPKVEGTATLENAVFLAEKVEQAGAKLNYRHGVLDVEEVVFKSPLLSVEGKASVKDIMGQQTLGGDFSLSKLQAERFSPWLGLPTSGLSGAFQGKGILAGTLTQPEMSLSLESEHLQLAGMKFSEVTASLSADREKLELNRFQCAGNSGEINLSARYDPEKGTADGQIEGKALSLKDLVHSTKIFAGPSPQLSWLHGARGSLDLEGEFEGKFFNADGHLQIPKLKGKLTGNDLLLRGEKLPELRVRVGYDGRKIKIQELRVIRGKEHLVISGYVEPREKIMLAAVGSGLRMESLSKFSKLPSLQGQLRGAVALGIFAEGPINAPDIYGSLEVKNLELVGFEYDRMQIEVALKEGSGLRGKAILERDGKEKANVEGKIPFRWGKIPQDEPLQVTAVLEEGELSTLALLVPWVQEAQGTISGRIRVKGTLKALSMDGHIQIKDGEAKFREAPGELKELNCALSFESTRQREAPPLTAVRIEELRGRFLEGPFSVTGTAELVSLSPRLWTQNKYHLAAVAEDINLAEFKTYLSGVSTPTGEAVFLEIPDMTGELELVAQTEKNGVTVATLRKFRAMSKDGGSIACNGRVSFKEPEQTKILENDFNLNIKIKGLRTKLPPYFQGEVRGENLKLVNPAAGEPAQLIGKLEIPKGVATLVTRKRGEIIPPESPLEMPRRPDFWNLTVVLGKEFFFILPRLKVPIAGAVSITGPMLTPLAHGDINSRPGGRAVSLSEHWDVKRLDVDFWATSTRSAQAWTFNYGGELDFRAETMVRRQDRRYDVEMVVRGSLHEPKCEFNATPYLPMEEILATLGHGEALATMMAGDQWGEVLAQQVLGMVQAEAAMWLLNPVARELEEVLGLEEVFLELRPQEPLRLRVTQKLAPDLTLSYITTITAEREEYDLKASYRLSRELYVGISRDETRRLRYELETGFNF